MITQKNNIKLRSVIVSLFCFLLAFPALAQTRRDFPSAIDSLAQKIVQALPTVKPLTLAVAKFKCKNQTQEFLNLVAEFLTTSIAEKTKSKVVERLSLKPIDELIEQRKEIFNKATAVEIGKMSGANAMVLGDCIDWGDEVELSARILNTEKGTAFRGAAGSVRIRKHLDYTPSTAGLDTNLANLFKNLLATIPSDPVQKIVVFPFDSRTEIGKRLAEAIRVKATNYIIQSGKVDYVERDQLDELLKETRFNASRLFENSANKNKFRELTGASIALVGTIFLDGDVVAIIARIVELKRNIVLSGSKILLDRKSKDIGNLLGPPPQIRTFSLPKATQGEYYTATLEITGGERPYKWTVESGKLPDGIILNKEGVVSGRPSMSGTYTFVINMTDARGIPATQKLSITVASPPPPPPQPKGTLVIRSENGGEVFLDDRPYGDVQNGEKSITDLTPQSYTIKVLKKGYVGIIKRNFFVGQYMENTLTANLERKPGIEIGFASILFPGLGDLIRDNGNWYLYTLIAGGAIGGHFILNNSYKKSFDVYLNEVNPDSVAKRYEDANIEYRWSKILLYTGIVVWAYDVIVNFIVGISNSSTYFYRDYSHNEMNDPKRKYSLTFDPKTRSVRFNFTTSF
jgi:curli biogenesis system outer membrane secretion channel CsgG